MNFLEKAMDDLYQSVHAYVSKAFNTLSERMTAVEKRVSEIPAGPKGDKGDPGRDAVIDPTIIEAAAQKAVAGYPIPKDGKEGQPGKSAYQLAVERGFTGTELQWLDSLHGKNGKDSDPIDEDAIVSRVRALIPTPKDGKDAEVDYERIGNAIKEVVDVAVPKAVDALPKPKDGDPGPKGDPGRDADEEAIIGRVTEHMQRAFDALPKPKDGDPGKDADMGAIQRSITEFFEQTADEFCKGLDDAA